MKENSKELWKKSEKSLKEYYVNGKFARKELEAYGMKAWGEGEAWWPTGADVGISCVEDFASRRWALSSGYWYAGSGGEPLEPEVYRNYGPSDMVELAGGDGLATSKSEPLDSWGSGFSTRLETRTKESNMDANVNGWNPTHVVKTNNCENLTV